MIKDKRIALEMIKNGGTDFSFEDLSNALQKDKDILLALLKKNEWHLTSMPDSVLEDEDFIYKSLELIQKEAPDWMYAYTKLAFDMNQKLIYTIWKFFVATGNEEYISHGLKLLGISREEFRDDKKLFELVLSTCGIALMEASERLKDDTDLVLMALKSSKGEALQYASTRLQNNPVILDYVSKLKSE